MKTLKDWASVVEGRLNTLIPELPEMSAIPGGMPWLLASSMRYSLLAGGKRLRPSMFLAAVEMLSGKPDEVIDIACAVEMIHTYSLIHDDLPGMDNDTLRRGRATNHVVYGEGQAILAGDGLLNLAFETMLQCALRHPGELTAYTGAINEIARGCGVTGMIAGQVLDLFCERNPAQLPDDALTVIQRDKTACMFMYPLRAAGRICGVDEATLEALESYGLAFGMLFQATDDLLDVVGSSAEVGKTLGKDAESGKLTCISEYGVDGTRALVAKLHAQAIESLKRIEADTSFFQKLVDDMVGRTY